MSSWIVGRLVPFVRHGDRRLAVASQQHRRHDPVAVGRRGLGTKSDRSDGVEDRTAIGTGRCRVAEQQQAAGTDVHVHGVAGLEFRVEGDGSHRGPVVDPPGVGHVAADLRDLDQQGPGSHGHRRPPGRLLGLGHCRSRGERAAGGNQQARDPGGRTPGADAGKLLAMEHGRDLVSNRARRRDRSVVWFGMLYCRPIPRRSTSDATRVRTLSNSDPETICRGCPWTIMPRCCISRYEYRRVMPKIDVSRPGRMSR